MTPYRGYASPKHLTELLTETRGVRAVARRDVCVSVSESVSEIESMNVKKDQERSLTHE